MRPRLLSRNGTAIATAAAWLLFARRSLADASPHFHLDNWYAPIGANIGFSWHPQRSDGLLLGAEASLVRLSNNGTRFAGGYADYLYDFGAHAHRVSVGPEFGWNIFGFDGGIVNEFASGAMHVGIRVRGYVSLVLLIPYIGQTLMFAPNGERTYTEFGALFKLPICLGGVGDCDFGVPLREHSDSAVPATSDGVSG
jgi:hypothetical protein